jgi:phage baseplate assembly protein W
VAQLADLKSNTWVFSVTGVGVVAEGLAAIKQSIEIVLKSTKGTDPLRPLFGSEIYSFIDKPVNVAIPNIKRCMIEAVEMWEPRVKILSIEHKTNIERIEFNINYILVDEGLIDALTLSLEGSKLLAIGAQGTLIVQGVIPPNPKAKRLSIDFVVNGNSINPVNPVDGFSDVASLFNFCSSNWSSYGRWALTTDRVLLYMNANGMASVALTISLNTSNVYRWPIPVANVTQEYALHFTVEGIDEVRSPRRIDTRGEMLSWVQAVWSKYGEWSLTIESGLSYLILISDIVQQAFLDIELVEAGDFSEDFNNDFFI